MPQKLYSRTEHLHIMVPSYLMDWVLNKCNKLEVSRTKVILMYLEQQYLREQEQKINELSPQAHGI